MNKRKGLFANIVNQLTPDYILLPVMFFLVVSSQYYLLHDTLTLGFKLDDWILYLSYKILGSNPLLKIASVWAERGLYTTYQVYYIGLLESLVGFNYQLLRGANLILKILATLSLYPLVLILFKRRMLAFFTVIIFSISFAAIGPLEFVVKGSDYLAIIWMNLFLITYYLTISNEKVHFFKRGFYKWEYFLLLLFFLLALISSPIRMFPLVIIPIMTELFLILKKHFCLITVKRSVRRLLILYFPFVFFLLFAQISLYGNIYSPVIIFKEILNGSWFMLLMPISGIGYAFIPDGYWEKIFGLLITNNFKSYLIFLLGGPTIVCGLLTLMLIWSRNLVHKFFFFIFTITVNFTIQLLIFFVAFHHLKIPTSSKLFYPDSLYSVIFGTYILVVSIMLFIYHWLKRKNHDGALNAIWVGFGLLFIFTLFTWLFAPVGTTFNGSSYYLVVASVGSSIIMAAFLVLLYDKIKSGRLKFLVFSPLLVFILIFKISDYEIHKKLFSLNENGLNADKQTVLQQEAKRVIEGYQKESFMLVYFDISDINGNGAFYYEGFLNSFPFFMHLHEDRLIKGCIGTIYEDHNLVKIKKTIRIQDGVKGFNYSALCINEEKGTYNDLFFTSNDFYAFKIKGMKLIDIKRDILNRLEF